jgi:glutathione S-transferase
MHAGFGALRSQMPMDMRARRSVPWTPELQDDVARIEALWTACRTAHGSGGEFLFGSWCAADAMYAPIVSRFRTYGVQLSPIAAAYAAAVWQWPELERLAAEAAAEPWSLDLEVVDR